MAKQVLANLARTPGVKRNRPRLIATINAHHSIHWANDANTDLDDLVLLCWHWSLEPCWAGHFVLRDNNGTIRPLRPHTIGLVLPAPAQLPLDDTAP